MMEIIQVLLLGLVQGVTELLPISSSAHVFFFQKILSFNAIEEKAFSSLIQIGSALALLCRLFPEIRFLFLGVCKKEKTALVSTTALSLALLPVILVGFFFSSFIKTTFYSNDVLAFSLMIGGALFLLLDPISHALRKEKIGYKEACLIGIFQLLSFIPGASRLGSTFLGGTIAGLSRNSLLSFSFLLAIPVLLGAGMHDLIHIHTTLTFFSTTLLTIGLLSAFTATYSLFPLLFQFLLDKGIFLMGWYRIALGTLCFFL